MWWSGSGDPAQQLCGHQPLHRAAQLRVGCEQGNAAFQRTVGQQRVGQPQFRSIASAIARSSVSTSMWWVHGDVEIVDGAYGREDLLAGQPPGQEALGPQHMGELDPPESTVSNLTSPARRPDPAPTPAAGTSARHPLPQPFRKGGVRLL